MKTPFQERPLLLMCKSFRADDGGLGGEACILRANQSDCGLRLVLLWAGFCHPPNVNGTWRVPASSPISPELGPSHGLASGSLDAPSPWIEPTIPTVEAPSAPGSGSCPFTARNTCQSLKHLLRHGSLHRRWRHPAGQARQSGPHRSPGLH